MNGKLSSLSTSQLSDNLTVFQRVVFSPFDSSQLSDSSRLSYALRNERQSHESDRATHSRARPLAGLLRSLARPSRLCRLCRSAYESLIDIHSNISMVTNPLTKVRSSNLRIRANSTANKLRKVWFTNERGVVNLFALVSFPLPLRLAVLFLLKLLFSE